MRRSFSCITEGKTDEEKRVKEEKKVEAVGRRIEAI